MQVFTTLKLPEVNSYSELLFFFYHTPLPDGTPTITVLLNFFFVAKNQLAFICSILRFSSSKLPTWAECCRAELKCRCQTDLPPSPPPPRSPEAVLPMRGLFVLSLSPLLCGKWLRNAKEPRFDSIERGDSWCCHWGNAWGGVMRTAVCKSHLYRARVHALYYADERKITDVL